MARPLPGGVGETPDGKGAAQVEIKRDITSSFELVKVAFQALTERGEFSFDNLDARLGRVTSVAINDAFRAKIEALLAVAVVRLAPGRCGSRPASGDRYPYRAASLSWGLSPG